MTHEQQLELLARSLIDDAKLDREVLRRRWVTPPWRDEIQHIADVLERHPLLIAIVQQQLASELAKLAGDVDAGGPPASNA
jgi:hypothetical protein